MYTDNRQILIYYNPARLSDRQTVAYAHSIADYVETFSFEDAGLSPSRWDELLDLLSIADPRLLLNEEDPYFKEQIKDRDFDRLSWLKILSHNPNLIKAPIAVRGDDAVICCLPKEVLRLVADKVEI